MSNTNKQSRNRKKDCIPTTGMVPTTNVSVSGQLSSTRDGLLSSTSAQSAALQPPPRPLPTSSGMIAPLPKSPEAPLPKSPEAPLPKSPEAPQLIAYVHNVSLLKRNKKNTIDYRTLTLQTDASTIQPALCYSKAKRKNPRRA